MRKAQVHGTPPPVSKNLTTDGAIKLGIMVIREL
jgi:hypothetical protein